MKKINKKVYRYLILALLVIIALNIAITKKDDFKLWRVQQAYAKKGYFICPNLECIPERLSKCEKTFFRMTLGNRFIDKIIYQDKDQCVLEIVKSDNEAFECHFDLKTWEGKEAPNINAANYKLFPESVNACKLIQR